jgi:hypothetical protein
MKAFAPVERPYTPSIVPGATSNVKGLNKQLEVEEISRPKMLNFYGS